MPNAGPPDSHSFVLPLPAELLVHIFELATDNPIRNIDLFVDLPPFESAASSDIEDRCDEALRVKYAIATACRGFRDLISEFFYEDIRVRYGSKTLADMLETRVTGKSALVGSLVKRAVLFPDGSENESGSQSITRDTRSILLCCSNLRAIFRPRLNVPRSTGDTIVDGQPITLATVFPFEHLQRVDWTSSPCDDPPLIAQVPQSVWSSQNLRTLSVGINEWKRFSGMQETETTEIFSHITTLRVRSLDAFGVSGQRLFTMTLPKLRRIVLDQPDSMYALFSIYQYGSQIRTLEFGDHTGFRQHDYISVMLVYCPNSTDLYIPIFSMHPTRMNAPGSHATSYPIEHLCLSAVDRSERKMPEDTKWAHLQAHFDSFCGPQSRFDKIQKVTLFGIEWRTLIKDSRVRDFLATLLSKGISLESNDQMICRYLQPAKGADKAFNLSTERTGGQED